MSERRYDMFYAIKTKGHSRRKRVFVPFIYFMTEVAGIWFLISFWQLTFNISHWSMLATVAIGIVSFPFALKMIDIYNRTTDEATLHPTWPEQ